MPISDVIGDMEGATLMESGDAPTANNAPSDPDAPTTMDTPPMLPPYIHNQTLDDRNVLALGGTALALFRVIEVLT